MVDLRKIPREHALRLSSSDLILLGIQILSRYLLLVYPGIYVLSWVAIEQLVDERVAYRVKRVVGPAIAGVAIAVNVVFYALVVAPPSRAFSADLTKLSANWNDASASMIFAARLPTAQGCPRVLRISSFRVP